MPKQKKITIYVPLAFIILAFASASIYTFSLLQREKTLLDSQHDNATWSATALQFEYLKLTTAFEKFIPLGDSSDRDRLLLQFELLWSRIPALLQDPNIVILQALPEYQRAVPLLEQTLLSLEPQLNSLDPHDTTVAANIRQELNTLKPVLVELVMATYQHRAASLTYGEAWLIELKRWLTLSFLGILVSGITLIFIMFKQLRLNKRLLTAEAQSTQALRREVDERKTTEAALAREKERAQVTLKSIGDAVITTDINGAANYLNPVAEQLTGQRNEAAAGQSVGAICQIVDERSGEVKPDPVAACLAQRTSLTDHDHTLLIRPLDGKRFPIKLTAAPIYDRAGNVEGAVLVFHDVSETRSITHKLLYQAAHDEITGLVNRREFEQRLHSALRHACADGTCHALLYLDLDQFKVVNDTCGHAAGDVLLRQVSGLLQAQLRSCDTLARLGGDEFGVLLSNCTLDHALTVADQLRQTVEGFRFQHSGRPFRIGVSIGLVTVDAQSSDLDSLLSAADVACYAAKEGGRNRIHVFQADDQVLLKRQGEMDWTSRITEALEQDRMRLFIQRIQSTHCGATDGKCFEILLRMVDERGNIVPPMAFLPAAERYNLMGKIDRWVVQNTLHWLTQNRNVQDCHFSINLSGQSLSDQRFLDWTVEALEEIQIGSNRIGFEITETAAISNIQAALAFISRLKEKGCLISLDDFGSGLSSFQYLKSLPVDIIKIDGAFIKDIVDDPIDEALVRSIIQIGQSLQLKTIAEFVENEAIATRLTELGVDYLQGYQIARPEPLATLASEPHFNVYTGAAAASA